ncbi:hypothetical protein QP794_03655 [Paenibacillus sp. UMB7766-LJ446]|nr:MULTISPECIES: hypothetical protein [Paenibacillus]MDK8189178.1 hypothetical protein [Paenibacillus sp. UMB7766-LJ446]OPG98816.1 hypothetical protein B2I21_10855 [Chryseobacterium mucoviscidosis]OZQ69955.1 hypothetical protein CA599_13100 [Paenibacillus taichungensis]HBU84338.1 hypothetical protein [Paenibacillus sp.]
MIVLTSSIAFTILILIVILFQVALAVGVPWGEYAMGGKFPGKYPRSMRFACLFQIAILAFIALVVLSKSGLILPGWSTFAGTAIWFIVAYLVLGTILNLITRSVWERRIWAPVTLLLLLTSVIIAIS